ncbi:hypothetical protein AO501_33910 [Mycobacterium gordonae]|uniref:Uncharacterized protein n=1 Tax=Mycobacterium gordonae TaxID=1778 RepID=A0A0Q2QJI9_MYCGO|nr:hypothetical protein AO501_33910 [Mycobacterium gordonae]
MEDTSAPIPRCNKIDVDPAIAAATVDDGHMSDTIKPPADEHLDGPVEFFLAQLVPIDCHDVPRRSFYDCKKFDGIQFRTH